MIWIIRLANLHPELKLPELKSLLHGPILQLSDSLYQVEASLDEIKTYRKFTSLGRQILYNPVKFEKSYIYESVVNPELIKPLFEKDGYFIDDKYSIAIRSKQLGKRDNKLPSQLVEQKIAKALYSVRKFPNINLRSPDYVLQVFIFGSTAIVGWVIHTIEFDEVHSRAPMNSPYFGGGALKPHLARILVNLLHPLPAIIMDPFSGHGGLLREIAEMGSTAIGLEVNYKISNQCKQNNYYHGLQDFVFPIVGDALHPPFRVNAITHAVTDPPYAIQTTTKGLDRDFLIREWLIRQFNMTVVISAPTEMLTELPEGWSAVLDVKDYVHRTLTRRIRKLIK